MREAFPLPERFQIRRRVGAGGMGVVYEAFDHERKEVVALKRLLRSDPSAAYRFKKEFRTLADLVHPNLVILYELVIQDGDCFFTMEMVQGRTFIEFVRADLSGKSGRQGVIMSRLSGALIQLAEGMIALHEVGIVHRDIKPSNVMVTEHGRVVILDFGLAAEFAPAETLTVERGITGTLDYLAPELTDGGAATPASDWYSFGVVLYQALTGRVPFEGSFYQVLRAKQVEDPQPVDALVSDLPRSLVELCTALTQRDPGKRPTGKEVLKSLGVPSPDRISIMPARLHTSFVGRHPQLEVMETFLKNRSGDPVSLYVFGPSGMGKTTLVQHLIDRVREKNRCVVLNGRCYERESIPFKAVDGIIDRVTKHLLQRTREEADALLPENVHALSRIFPALLQVESIARGSQPTQRLIEPTSLRHQAFRAFRELLRLFARGQLLVLHIDDFHWADPDSIALLDDLVRPPNAPPLVLILSFRSEEIDSKPFLQTLLQEAAQDVSIPISVDPLSKMEVCQLIEMLLPPGRALSANEIESIEREAAGCPFLVEQLVRHVLETEHSKATGITLAEMLSTRMGRLPEGANRLMEVVAVAGRPIEVKVAVDAASIPDQERRVVAALRAAHLLRSSVSATLIEPYHDRIRETVTELVHPEDARQIHGRLADSLVRHGMDDPEALVEHYAAAGNRDLAAHQASLAAEKAGKALAFDRAAFHYRRTIDLGHPLGSKLIQLEIRLAEALVHAGRAAEAAEVYLATAERVPADRALALRQIAASQLLVSGHIDRGMEVIRGILQAVRMKFPTSRRRALLSLIINRARLLFRGLHFTGRNAEELPEKERLKIDLCWAVAVGFAIVDTVRTNIFSTHHLLLALQAGDVYRIARGLALEASSMAVTNGGRKQAEECLKTARKLSAELKDPYIDGMISNASGVFAFFDGEWKKSLKFFEQAEEILRDRCTGITPELTAAQFFQVSCLQYLGDINTVFHRRLALLSAAHERGDLFLETHCRIRLGIVWLAADDPAKAEKEITDTIAKWSDKAFHIQHFITLVALAQVDLYRGLGVAAYERVQNQWSGLSMSLLTRVKVIRIEANYLRARCALAAAEGMENPQRLLKQAERQCDRLAGETTGHATLFAALARAAIAVRRGRVADAISLLSTAAEGFTARDMALYAAVSRRRLGELLPGATGQSLIEDADDWMKKQRIINPNSMTRMIAPGFPPLNSREELARSYDETGH